ncbi:MAG: hypothetical protein GY804_09080 [Alphaproteobacteria bacterium]|nr:hypothetical protein [Alphaproteobacteria bacterium]
MYKLSFVPCLSTRLDGVYRIVSINSRDSYIADSGDCLTDLFEPNGLTEEDMAPYAEEIEVSRIAYIENVNTDEDPFPVPICLFPTYPVTNLKPYGQIGLGIDLGPWADQEQLDIILSAISDIVKSIAGVDVPPVLMKLHTLWMTATEYETIKTQREQLKSTTTTYFSECQNLRTRNNTLEAIIAAYNQTLINISEE